MPQQAFRLVDESGQATNPTPFKLVDESGAPAGAPAAPSFLDSATDFAKGFVGMVNPLPTLKSLYDNSRVKKAVDAYDHGDYLEAAKHLAIATTPVGLSEAVTSMAQGMVRSQLDQFRKAKTAYDNGNYSEAVGHTIAGATPLVGPAAATAGETIGSGQIAKGLGQTTALLLPSAVKAAVALTKGGPVLNAKVPSSLNPVEQAAVDFGDTEGIPVDAATRSGNGAIAGAQNILAKSPGSAGFVKGARQAQADALAATGEKLRTQIDPTLGNQAVTPEAAGQGMRDALTGRVSALKQFEDQAYSKFREVANDPANVQEVQVGTQSATMKSRVDEMAATGAAEDMKAWASSTRETRGFQTDSKNGVAHDATDWQALNAEGKNTDELATVAAPKVGQSSGTKEGSPLAGFKESPKQLADAIQSGQTAIAAGSTPSPLFTKIQQAFTDSIVENRGDEIRTALKEAGLQDTGAGMSLVPITKKLALPVDMRPIKASLKPLYEQMQTWMEPAKRNASAGVQAVSSIVKGPDHLPATVAEQGLSGLKTLARVDNPDLRDVNAGLGANAAKQLQASIDRTVGAAGPDAIDALRAGRMAHAAKMGTADVLNSLREEPVQAFNQAVWAKDAGIDKLRDVAKLAPAEMPKLGRAYLGQLLDKATTEGGFDKTQSLQTSWSSLGPQTKRLLFQNPMLIEKLDNFFLLAKKISENPNPSGTASTAATLAAGGLLVHNPVLGTGFLVGTRALAQLLYSPKGSTALMKGLQVPLGNKAAAALAADQILSLAGNDKKPLALNPAP